MTDPATALYRALSQQTQASAVKSNPMSKQNIVQGPRFSGTIAGPFNPAQAQPIPCSVIVMTKNEEANIDKCLRTLVDFDEIFVVDSGSSDNTRSIAAAMGAKVVGFCWNGQYPKKKQWCLDNLPFTYDWVLYLDADEELTPLIRREMARKLTAPTAAGYFVSLNYVFERRLLRHGHKVYKLILFKRQLGSFPEYPDLEASNMWEVEGHYQPQIKGSVSFLRESIVHDDHATLFHYFDRHNRYSDWEAVLYKKNRSTSIPRDSHSAIRSLMKVAIDVAPCRGVLAFVHSYLLKLGFLDGRAGLDFAISRGFYFWQIGIKTRERLEHLNSDICDSRPHLKNETSTTDNPFGSDPSSR